MKRIFSYLFAIITLMGTTSVFTSCQEDAPAINYTINVTVNNDFTEVVNAINNGNLSQSDAIEALTAAINQMSGDQAAKLQALVEAINSLATTVDAKLAIIEAAMKAQTLALENKLALLEAAIKALPDYTDKLAAIETAIKNIPDYKEKMDAIIDVINNAKDYTDALNDIKDAISASNESFATQIALLVTAIEKLPDYRAQLTAIKDAIPTIPNYEDQFAAIELALKAIAANIEAQEGQYADELEDLTESIDAITKAVEDGNKSQKDALAEIIALLESGALAGGGSGSGSGGEGEGGEDEGGEGEDPYIIFKTDKQTDIEVSVIPCEIKTAEGVSLQEENTSGDMGYTHYYYDLISNPVKLTFNGNPTVLNLYWEEITEIDLSKLTALEVIYLQRNKLTKVDFSHNKNLKEIYLYIDYDNKCNFLTSEAMHDVVKSLPDRSGKEEAGKFVIGYTVAGHDCPILPDDVAIAEGKNWELY